MANHCLECNDIISQNVNDFSVEEFGVPLCWTHQNKFRYSKATYEAIELYFALRIMGVPAKLEQSDGFKTVDIAIPECKVNIEVDGPHHNVNHIQALSDLKRTFHSFVDGYITLRIPNSLVQFHLDDTTNYIIDFLNEKNNKGWGKIF